MELFNNIENENILIVPNTLKEKILRYLSSLKKLVNVKLYSFEDLKKIIYFDYDKDAILYLMEHYNFKYEVAKNYIDNMYYVEDKIYTSLKLENLLKLKKELLNLNLLKKDKFFLQWLKSKKAIVLGYDYVDSFNQSILHTFSCYEIVPKTVENVKIPVYEFNTLEDEIIFVIRKIIELTKKGVSLNNIYVVGTDSNYQNEMAKLFSMYNLEVGVDNTSSIMTTAMGKDAFDYLGEHTFAEVCDYIKGKYDLSNEGNYQIYGKIISIFNEYTVCNNSKDTILKAIYYEFNNNYINKMNLKNYVRLESLNNNYFSDDDYVFLVGFNQGVIPRIYKDEDFISDALKSEVGLETSSELNKITKDVLLASLKSIKNIVVSYKLHYLNDEFYPSNLLCNDIFERTTFDFESNVAYSYDYSSIKLAEMIDDLIKYGKKDKQLPLYFKSFDIPYLKYDNKFNGIDVNYLKSYLGKLTLSYSNVDTFYKCQFRFYLDNILKINKYDETFDTFVGSLFHYVLSRLYMKDFDLERDYEYYIHDRTFTSKEKFFLDRLKKELIIICDYLQKFNNMTGLTNVFTEKKISIDKSSDLEVTFKGIIDKIMYKNYDGKTLVAVIDYKTGSTDIDIYNSAYGIGMQLLIYLYLISKSNLFDSFEIVGFYLQRVLNTEVNIEPGLSYSELKSRNLKLYGYSTDDAYSLEKFDSTYENSEYIMSMKYGKNGFYKYSKILSDDDIKSLIRLVDSKIENARDAILNGEFYINPKWISGDKEAIGCKFCRYKDICFRKNEDIVNLKRYSDLSFLNKEGDINA